jgi:hypothetical protein
LKLFIWIPRIKVLGALNILLTKRDNYPHFSLNQRWNIWKLFKLKRTLKLSIISHIPLLFHIELSFFTFFLFEADHHLNHLNSISPPEISLWTFIFNHIRSILSFHLYSWIMNFWLTILISVVIIFFSNLILILSVLFFIFWSNKYHFPINAMIFLILFLKYKMISISCSSSCSKKTMNDVMQNIKNLAC